MSEKKEEHDNCALPLVRRVYALLGRDDSGVRTGDPLPRGWHFIRRADFNPAEHQEVDPFAVPAELDMEALRQALRGETKEVSRHA